MNESLNSFIAQAKNKEKRLKEKMELRIRIDCTESSIRTLDIDKVSTFTVAVTAGGDGGGGSVAALRLCERNPQCVTLFRYSKQFEKKATRREIKM